MSLYRPVTYCAPARYELGVKQGTCLTKKELEDVAQEVVLSPLPKSIKKKELHLKMLKKAEIWAPYKTYACLHLWKWKDTKAPI